MKGYILAQIILYNGVKPSGMVLSPKGVDEAPSLDPHLWTQLEALANLARVGASIEPGEKRRQMAQLVTRLTSLVLLQLEAMVGQVDEVHGLVYHGASGDEFVSGSSGQVFLPRAEQRDHAGDPMDSELLDFVQKVILDGRYIKTWMTDPSHVARELGVELSQSAIERILSLKGVNPLLLLPLRRSPEFSQAVGAIAVIGIAIVAMSKPADLVIDESGVDKL